MGHGYFVMKGGGGGTREEEEQKKGRCCHWNLLVLSLAVLSFISFFITIIVLGGTYPKGGPKTDITLGLSETRIVTIRSHWFDTFEGGEVTLLDRTPNNNATNSTGKFVQLMKFAKRPPLSIIDTWESNITAILQKTDYYFWSWFFFAGSSLDLHWNFTRPENGFGPFLYFIKSEKGYDAFMEWVDVREPSLISAYLLGEVASNNFSFTIQEDDFYFAFFWNPSPTTALRGFFSFNISSVIFDVSNPESSCYLPCSHSVPFENDAVILVVSPRANQFVAVGVPLENDNVLLVVSPNDNQFVAAGTKKGQGEKGEGERERGRKGGDRSTNGRVLLVVSSSFGV